MDGERMASNWRDRCIAYPNIMFGQAVRNARVRATKKKIEFAISRKYVKGLFDTQNGLCYYSGIKMNIVKRDPDVMIDPLKMTLDLVDPSKGYVPGNIVWCVYCINAMKQKMTKESLVSICKSVVNHTIVGTL
jgi:hypothetical protein